MSATPKLCLLLGDELATTTFYYLFITTTSNTAHVAEKYSITSISALYSLSGAIGSCNACCPPYNPITRLNRFSAAFNLPANIASLPSCSI